MKKLKLLTKPTQISAANLDDLALDNQSWEQRAQKLQARRWRKLREETA